jgi:hypothetical protein
MLTAFWALAAQARDPEPEETTAVAKAAATAEQLAPQSQPVTGAMVASSLAAAAGESLAAVIAALPPSPAQLAAESLAAATGGAVVAEVLAGPGFDASQPLTDGEIADAVAMLKGFTPQARKSFTIAFRDAFRVPREEKGISPLIKQAKHLKFFYDWSIEAAGGVAP